jgi:hypothetical protein
MTSESRHCEHEESVEYWAEEKGRGVLKKIWRFYYSDGTQEQVIINRRYKMNLIAWAAKWGVSLEALDDLKRELGITTSPQKDSEKKEGSEAAVQSKVRLEAAKKDIWLLRNNVGAGCMKDGSFVRWGLANDSKKLNEVCKSSDLIVIRKVKILPEMVGQIIGQFVARETKHENWTYKGNAREKAQLNFLLRISSFGGDAAFATEEGTL